MATFEKQSVISVPAWFLFQWHARPGAFQRLVPPWEQIELVSQTGGIRDGAQVRLRVRIGWLSKSWLAEHWGYVEGVQFQDVQLGGPFSRFEHTHRMRSLDDETCVLDDHIEYALPLGWLGNLLAGRFVRGKLERTFAYRHDVTRLDAEAHWRALQQQNQAFREDSTNTLLARAVGHDAPSQGQTTMKILVTGATGLVGSALVPFLTTGGHDVSRLIRSQLTEPGDIPWNPDAGELQRAGLEGHDAVVHLAGENLAGKRWNAKFKERLRSSRINSTRLLCETLAQLKSKPKTLVCASAIGIYGDRGAELLNETSPVGEGFLPELCRDWEAACEPARAARIRVVNLRIGVVLSPKGGALASMLKPFKLGVGGVVGTGHQYWSWVSIDDVVGAIHHCLTHETIRGPVNVTASQPATNYDFTKTLGRVLQRPTVVPMPGLVAQMALGEMAKDLLLSSTRVMPNRLSETGYQFRYPSLEGALRHLLGT